MFVPGISGCTDRWVALGARMTIDLRLQLLDVGLTVWLLLKRRRTLCFSWIDPTQLYSLLVVVEMLCRLSRGSTGLRTFSRWTSWKPATTLRRHSRERRSCRRRRAVLLHKHQRTLYRHLALTFKSFLSQFFSNHNFFSDKITNLHVMLGIESGID